MAYRSLDSAHIIRTLERLTHRIDERFPGAGLTAVSKELLALGRFCATEAEEVAKPHWPIRTAALILILLVIGLSGFLLLQPWIDGTPMAFDSVGDYLQAIEAAINEFIFIAIAIYFLTSLEGRHKRRRALAAIHQLRSISHVVDMHQLTKDPHHLMDETHGRRGITVEPANDAGGPRQVPRLLQRDVVTGQQGRRLSRSAPTTRRSWRRWTKCQG